MQKAFYYFLGLILLLGFFSNVTFAASEAKSFSGEFQVGQTVYVFGDKVNIRQSASANSPVVGQAKIGQALVVKEKSSATFQVDGFEDYWYKVSSPKASSKPISGFIWGGILAKVSLNEDLDNDGKKELVLLGIIGKGKEQTNKNAEVRLLKNDLLVSKVLFPTIESADGHQFTYSLEANLLENKGFKPAVKILRFYFHYDACDYASGDVLLTANDNKLKYALSALSSGNELGSQSFIYVLPTDKNGKENQLKVIETIEEFEEKTNPKAKEVQMVSKAKKESSKIYVWNGNELKLNKK
jgi:hypothetical protein